MIVNVEKVNVDQLSEEIMSLFYDEINMKNLSTSINLDILL